MISHKKKLGHSGAATPKPSHKRPKRMSFKQNSYKNFNDAKERSKNFLVIDDKHSLSNLLFKAMGNGERNQEDYLVALTNEKEFGFDEINKLIMDENENFNYLRNLTEEESYFS